jgi:hypothetical protein
MRLYTRRITKVEVLDDSEIKIIEEEKSDNNTAREQHIDY